MPCASPNCLPLAGGPRSRTWLLMGTVLTVSTLDIMQLKHGSAGFNPPDYCYYKEQSFDLYVMWAL